MAVYKDKERGTWYVAVNYKNWMGERKKKWKRGFKTKKEAIEWELSFRTKEASTLDMNFSDFVEIYEADVRPRLKENTWLTKEVIIKKKLVPYFKNKKMNQIKAADIIKWQNAMMDYKDDNGKSYSPPYLRTLQAQLSAIFNHAVRLYELPKNPVRIAGPMGGKRKTETLIWTTEEYKKFAEAISDRPESYYAFEVLFWCGLRIGELLALTAEDVDTVNGVVNITKSLQRIHGENVITSPKTEKSVRIIPMPKFLTEEMKQYKGLMYGLMPDDRLFPTSKGYMHHEMDRGSELAGVPRIRIHDLRHSHVSLLIEMGFTLVDIAKRMGHENVDITMHYAHIYPKKQSEIANKLDAFNPYEEVS